MRTTLKLFSGYALGTLALGYAVYAGHSVGADPTEKALNVLLCVGGGVFGWIAGMLLTPFEDERSDFSRVGGALLTFVTGYLLAKVDPLLNAQLQAGGAAPGLMIRSLLFAVSFGVGALFVFVGRRYWRDQPARPLDAAAASQ